MLKVYSCICTLSTHPHLCCAVQALPILVSFELLQPFRQVAAAHSLRGLACACTAAAPRLDVRRPRLVCLQEQHYELSPGRM